MKTTGLALFIGCAAGFLFSGAAGGCGGVTAALPGDAGTDGSPSSGSSSGGTGSGSSSGISGSSSSSSGASGSSSSSGGSSSSSGASGSSSSGGSSSSSGVSSSSSSGGSSGGGPDTGTLYFEQCSGSVLCASPTFDFYGSFGPASGGGTEGCTVTTSGECSSYTCTGTQPNPTGVSAGTLTLAGGSLGSVAVSPDASNDYSYEAGGTFFTAGQTLTVSATGGVVPAFGPISVVAPGLPLLTSPVAASSAGYTISTEQDLVVAWGGGEAEGQMIFEASSSDSSSYFTCVWPASEAKAVVPQAMLTPLAGQSTGYLIYGQYLSTGFTAGAYSISVTALPYSGGSATFQ